jgi:3-deoxy-D-manno-octulosonic-acid transferase
VRLPTLADVVFAVAGTLALPFLAFSRIRQGKARTDWPGRRGKGPVLGPTTRPTVLIHGVSVGEVVAARGLVEALEWSGADGSVSDEDEEPASGSVGEKVPRIVVSATTDTGFQRARELFGDRYIVVRYPLDFSWMVRRLLDRVRPDVIVTMELEIWPNFSAEADRRGIPQIVANGRLSASSFENYRRVRRLVRPQFERLAAVGAQTRAYGDRFEALGTPADRVEVTGSMKWDSARFEVDEGALDRLAADLGIDRDRPLVVAGSTGPGEEAFLLERCPPDVQLLVAPRKPERFAEVAALDASFVRRSARGDGPGAVPSGGANRFLLDTIGELDPAYALADVVILGRSFVFEGGSSPMEPLALGRPTVIGPRHEHFADVVEALVGRGGIVVAEDPMAEALALLADPERAGELGRRGLQSVRDLQGASARTAEMVRSRFPATS